MMLLTADDAGTDGDGEYVDVVLVIVLANIYMVMVMPMMWAKLGEWSLNCLIDSSPLNSHWRPM